MLFRIATSLSPLPLPLLVDCGSLRRRQERGRPRLARGLYVLATLTQLLMCCICFTTFVFLGFFVFVLCIFFVFKQTAIWILWTLYTHLTIFTVGLGSWHSCQ